MNWIQHSRGFLSGCRQYELRPTYAAGHFSYHGRHIDSDKLVAASADPEYVKQCCERHAQSALSEVS
jgi:hypothetical protein